jgi:hypothetical protein
VLCLPIETLTANNVLPMLFYALFYFPVNKKANSRLNLRMTYSFAVFSTGVKGS